MIEYATATVRLPFIRPNETESEPQKDDDGTLQKLVEAGWRILTTESLTVVARVEYTTVLLFRESL